jgi:hypothetical protein
MVRFLVAAASGVALLALAGCETLPEMDAATCAAADWRQLGYQDGATGRSAGHFAIRQQLCANYGYEANAEAYNAGHGEGIRTFCRPEQAYRLGEEGRSIGAVCPPETQALFADAYNEGRRLYLARSEWESAESTIRSLFSQREDLLRKLNANELGLARSATPEEKARHESEVLRLRNELVRVDRRIEEAEREAYWRRQNYDRERWRSRNPY